VDAGTIRNDGLNFKFLFPLICNVVLPQLCSNIQTSLQSAQNVNIVHKGLQLYYKVWPQHIQ